MATSDKVFEAFVNKCRKAVAHRVSGRTEVFQALWSKER